MHNQVIAGFCTNDFWLGSLGFSLIPFNFTNLNYPQPSLLTTLYNQSLIPNLTWAYTAGAHYQDPPVLGSLTLGGYDTTRFTPNNVTFAFGAGVSRNLFVRLRSITYNTLGSSPLLARDTIFLIDSMITQLWLPVDVCQAFERAFNLTWNATAELYLLDEDTHNVLLAQNPTFIFHLGNGSDGSSSVVDIVIPYAVFDLNVTQPLVNSDMRYFPVKRAENSSQYTLGRVFLQEAYVIADYARQNFFVSQALFPQTNVAQNLVPILPPGYKQDHHGARKLSSDAIPGVTVASVVVIAVIAVCLWHRAKRQQTERMALVNQLICYGDRKAGAAAQHIEELDGEAPTRELDGRHAVGLELEASGSSGGRHELAGPIKVHEMEGNDVPAAELEATTH